MRILIAADLHYELARSGDGARELAGEVCAGGGGAIVLAGDTVGAELEWWRPRPDRFAFAAAFMGSSPPGQVLLDCDKVRDVYCGHSHWAVRAGVGRVRAINVPSTYTTKRLEVLEI